MDQASAQLPAQRSALAEGLHSEIADMLSKEALALWRDDPHRLSPDGGPFVSVRATVAAAQAASALAKAAPIQLSPGQSSQDPWAPASAKQRRRSPPPPIPAPPPPPPPQTPAPPAIGVGYGPPKTGNWRQPRPTEGSVGFGPPPRPPASPPKFQPGPPAIRVGFGPPKTSDWREAAFGPPPRPPASPPKLPSPSLDAATPFDHFGAILPHFRKRQMALDAATPFDHFGRFSYLNDVIAEEHRKRQMALAQTQVVSTPPVPVERVLVPAVNVQVKRQGRIMRKLPHVRLDQLKFPDPAIPASPAGSSGDAPNATVAAPLVLPPATLPPASASLAIPGAQGVPSCRWYHCPLCTLPPATLPACRFHHDWADSPRWMLPWSCRD